MPSSMATNAEWSSRHRQGSAVARVSTRMFIDAVSDLGAALRFGVVGRRAGGEKDSLRLTDSR